MRKIGFVGALLAAAMCLAACSTPVVGGGYDPTGNTAVNTGEAIVDPGPGENTAVNGDETPLLSVEDLLKVSSLSDLRGGRDKFTVPFYRSQFQYDEGFLLVANEDGSVDPVQLAFPIAKALEVKSNDLNTIFKEGKDYSVSADGKLVIPDGSAIAAMPHSLFFSKGNNGWKYKVGDDFVDVNDRTADLYRYRYTVTYIRTEAFGGDTSQIKQGEQLTHFAAKVQDKSDVNMLVLGDSIAAGAGVKDFPKWAEQVRDGIASATECKVTLVNGAVPGIHTSEYGHLIAGKADNVAAGIRPTAVKTWNEIVLPNVATADLAVITIGANDAGGWCGQNGISVVEYTQNIKRIIDFLRSQNADVSIVLVSCMQTNPNVYTTVTADKKEKLAAADFGAYADALDGIRSDLDYAARKNMAFADVYGIEKELLKRKPIEDMLGDNLNHPSDYMTRIYTQVILETVL